MSKLDELIKELCPNGVEFKKLGELGTIYNGLTGKNKNDFLEGNKRYITYVNVFNNISIDIGSQDKVKIDENEKQNKVEYGDIIFTASSENIEDVGMTSVLTSIIEEDLYLNSFCFGFRFKNNIMSPSFSKYLFRSENLRKQIRKTANGVTRFNISKEKIKEILIPILPLKIQEEIVRILDDYTKSVEELKEKLNSEFIAREKQYEFYRNLLLTFETENNSLSKTRQDKTRQDKT
ncbi:restriction endonuclease subunit S [Fusobacterium hwasookii]|uniref:restriction endonuclease subunit S n=1 Tax=Fusobacterium hwasookii TaxID=1583098 RepID=UPI000497FC87|nr:restriction endonuclease subunit S [Fusobacterium hwasookii]QNE68575.1 restriction endonuclease subunit S [Fusobacterium hwasookii]